VFIKNKLLQGKNDLYTGVLLVFFSVLLYVNSFNLADVVAFYPRVVLFIIGAIGVILIIRPIKKTPKNKKETQKISPDNSIRNMSVNIIAVLLIWILAPMLGFYVALFLYVGLMVLYIGGNWRYGEILNSFIYSTFFVVFLYVMFNMLLMIQTPSGILI